MPKVSGHEEGGPTGSSISQGSEHSMLTDESSVGIAAPLPLASDSDPDSVPPLGGGTSYGNVFSGRQTLWTEDLAQCVFQCRPCPPLPVIPRCLPSDMEDTPVLSTLLPSFFTLRPQVSVTCCEVSLSPQIRKLPVRYCIGSCP